MPMLMLAFAIMRSCSAHLTQQRRNVGGLRWLRLVGTLWLLRDHNVRTCKAEITRETARNRDSCCRVSSVAPGPSAGPSERRHEIPGAAQAPAAAKAAPALQAGASVPSIPGAGGRGRRRGMRTDRSRQRPRQRAVIAARRTGALNDVWSKHRGARSGSVRELLMKY